MRLRRVNHTEEIVAGFSKLLKSESMTDVTLICSGGQTIRAHQVILATFSPYFRAIFEAQPFTNNPCQYPVIVIKDLAFSELRAILEFIYRGEVSISRDKLSLVLQAAKALEVSGLSDLKVESAINGAPITSSSSSSSAQVADSSDVMDSSLLASLHHNSMSAINAVSSSGLNGNKRSHESMIYPPGIDGLKKSRMAYDQADPMQSIDRIGLSLLENGLNLANNPMAARFGQNNNLNRSILEMMVSVCGSISRVCLIFLIISVKGRDQRQTQRHHANEAESNGTNNERSPIKTAKIDSATAKFVAKQTTNFAATSTAEEFKSEQESTGKRRPSRYIVTQLWFKSRAIS